MMRVEPGTIDHPNLEAKFPTTEPTSTTTSSAEVWDLCRDWLRSCRSTHKGCGHLRQPSGYRPSRLIHVEQREDGATGARLSCDNATITAPYLTLSHCWGTSRFFTLREDNLEMLQKEIDCEKLPRVFRDAFVATLRLGFSYVWIDSLCIVQDSRDDWCKLSTW
jgi:hypothetical protein